MALPTFVDFRDRLCGDEFGCTYKEQRIELPPGSYQYVTVGIFTRGSIGPVTFARDDIGPVMDKDSICSILGRLGIPGSKFDVVCPKR